MEVSGVVPRMARCRKTPIVDGPRTRWLAIQRAKEALVAGRIQARQLAASRPEAEGQPLAHAFCYRMVRSYWNSLTDERVPLRPFLKSVSLADLPEPTQALAHSMGIAAARLESEAACYEIGLTYAGMLPEGLRSRFGIYYTPPALTARLIDQATSAGVNWSRCRVLDPACGGGAFLTPVVKRMVSELPQDKPAIVINNVATRVCGFEIDPFSAWLSQIALDATLLPLTSKTNCQLPVVVNICDTLRRRPDNAGFDLVIGNPPYGRVSLTTEDRKRYQRSLYGHANLYGLFTDVALRYVGPKGVIAYVTPTSFLAGEYFKNLRALLGRRAPPVTIDFLSVRKGVFEGVLQETLLATYRRGSSRRSFTVQILTPKDGNRLQVDSAGKASLPVDLLRPWMLPRSAEQAWLVARLNAMGHRLADWGYGVSTGPLVWNRHKNQLQMTNGGNELPLIWAECINADGSFVYRAEKKNHAPYFLPKAGDDWLVTRDPCVLIQRTTAKEQHRRLIAAALPAEFISRHGAVVIENHLNMIRPIVPTPPVRPDVLASFLNSRIADQAFRCVGGSVAVSAYELESLPLPPPTSLERLTHLVNGAATREMIDEACARLYTDPAVA